MRAKRKTPKRRSRIPRRSAAATGDILGRSPVDPAIPEKWKKYSNRLRKIRSYLTRRQDDIVQDAREEKAAFSLHMADVATDSYDRDIALSRASSEQEALYEIDAALERIRDGTYGICELTGKPIERARLEALPWTRFSLEAEEMLEREGQVQRARLAPRVAVPRGGADDSGSDNSNEG